MSFPDDVFLVEMAKLQEEHAKVMATKPAHEAIPIHNKIAEVRKAMGEALSKGAKPCAKCQKPPIGTRSATLPLDPKDGSLGLYALYSVVCVNCSIGSARATSPEGAVKNWNEGKMRAPRAA